MPVTASEVGAFLSPINRGGTTSNFVLVQFSLYGDFFKVDIMRKGIAYLLAVLAGFSAISIPFLISAVADIVFREDARALFFLLIQIVMSITIPFICVLTSKQSSPSAKRCNIFYFAGAIIAFIAIEIWGRTVDYNQLFPNRGEFDKIGLGLALCFFIHRCSFIWFILVNLIYKIKSINHKGE